MNEGWGPTGPAGPFMVAEESLTRPEDGACAGAIDETITCEGSGGGGRVGHGGLGRLA
jgi:hypothetical protein